MIEIRLAAVSFNIQPITDAEEKDGKQINFIHAPSQTAYLVPMSQEAADVLIADLQMPNDELEKKLQQKMLESRLGEPKIEIPHGIDEKSLREGPPPQQ